MLIYSPYNHPRLRYAIEIVLENYKGKAEFTTDKDFFQSHTGIKIEYAEKQTSEHSFFIQSHTSLWNDDIAQHEVVSGTWNELKTIYPSVGSIPFDVFSATFFLISRYEEYLPFESDKMNRFPASQSLASKQGFLHRPMIDLWRKEFEKEIISIWPNAQFEQRASSFLSTIDVDSAFAYKHKGLKRTLGGIARDILRFDFVNLFSRIKTLLGAVPDIYETYDYITEQCDRHKARNLYFFLLADFGQYDKNVPHTSFPLKELIKRLSVENTIGIHPGVASNYSIEKLVDEKKRLEVITGNSCKSARQHYLMLWFPKTYQAYLKAGIEQDYSMGFADQVGFRAGTSRPFYWFDLEKNEKTLLCVFPFAAMDTTLKNYMKLTKQEAIDFSGKMMNDVHAVGGDFIALWHNETLSETNGWQGWREVWEATLQMSSSKDFKS